MTDWYYHDPVQGRIGPLSAEQLRNRYADRRIQRDTLAWHAGAREWQPREELGTVAFVVLALGGILLFGLVVLIFAAMGR